MIYLNFIFIVAGHAKVTIYRFLFETPSLGRSARCNRRYMTSIRCSFCVSRRDGEFNDDTQEISSSTPLRQESVGSKTVVKLDLSRAPSRARAYVSPDVKARGIYMTE